MLPLPFHYPFGPKQGYRVTIIKILNRLTAIRRSNLDISWSSYLTWILIMAAMVSKTRRKIERADIIYVYR
jgi:hypothetical protein